MLTYLDSNFQSRTAAKTRRLEYHEGRAIVEKTNEFHELKYGFVDERGKEIFPCVLSNRPGNFSSGLARIEPKDKGEFDYAYIDRDGKIALKMKFSNGIFEDFDEGYAFTATHVMDTTGKIIFKSSFLQKFKIPAQDINWRPASALIERELQHSPDDFLKEKKFFSAWKNKRAVFGIFDARTKKIVNAAFDYIDPFDKASRLAYAKIIVGYDDTYQANIYREGYINEDGLFVIVKGTASKW